MSKNSPLPKHEYQVNTLRTDPVRDALMRVVAGLMRKLEAREIRTSELDLRPPKGLIITSLDRSGLITLFEDNDGEKETLD